MKKILITGSNGLLGQSLLDLFLGDKEYQLIALSRGENRYPIKKGYAYYAIDLTNKNQLEEIIVKESPDYIINTAAMTNVDACEDNTEECDAINVTLVENLVELCKQTQAKLIHISTDFIFDGEQGYYKETDTPNPLSYYGNSKLRSEKVIENIDYVILRTILVFGKVHDMSRSNIVLWVRQMLQDKKELTIVNDQFRMPTYVKDLALACKLSVDKGVKGVFNVSSSELLSVYEIAKQIAEVFNLDGSLISPISTATLNQKAARPSKTGFNLDKTKKQLGLPIKTFIENLKEFKLELEN